MRERVLLTLIQILFFPAILFSQTGIIKGTITDQANGETLIGATVLIKGTTKGTITDFDGNYLINNLTPGTYNIVISYVAYATETRENIQVKDDQATVINIILKEATTELEAVKVVGKANREVEAMLLLEQREAVIAKQAIGAKELSRKGVSDAEGAVTKVSGISKQSGAKNVIVRGLGDRYNATTFNGFPMPSEDPEYKNIALDFFTSDVIQSVGIKKVFEGSHSGDVGGALIDITSKELIKASELELSVSAGINSQAMGKDFYKTDGVNAFGYTDVHAVDHPTIEGDEVKRLDEYIFKNSLDPIKTSTPVNNSISLAGGKKFNNKHSFFLVGSYSKNSFVGEGINRKTTTTDPDPFRDFKYNLYEQNTSHMLMGNLNLNYDKHEISYNVLYLHTNFQYFSEYFGKEGEIFQNVEDESGSEGLLRRQQINDNSLVVNQLIWNSQLSPRIKTNLGIAYNYLFGAEPDRRINYLAHLGNDTLELRQGDARHQRFFSELNNNDLNAKANLTYKLSDSDENISSLSIGYQGRYSFKDFVAPIYNKDWRTISLPTFPIGEVELDRIFNNENLVNGDFTVDYYEDYYDVKRYVNGAYINLVNQIGSKFTSIIGARLDQIYLKLSYNVNKGGLVGDSKLDKIYLLPSLNIKYALTEKHSVRFGASKTYTLPQDKELAPFIYNGRVYESYGNPKLKPSENYNIDLKWDYYISRSEILTLNGFYKLIKKPIARVDAGSSAGYLTYDNISDEATAAGVEIEFRKQLFETQGSFLTQNLMLGLNGSYMHTDMFLKSDIIKDDERHNDLEGASPIISNADLTYTLKGGKIEWVNAVVLNYFSDKVHTIGTSGYQNIIEQDRATLDFITSTEIGEHWKVSIKAKNLLNPEYKLTRKPNSESEAVILDQYKKGISMSLGISYKF